MRKGLAVLLSLCIAFLPAVCSARAGNKIPGFYRSLAPRLPMPGLRKAAAWRLNLKLAPSGRPGANSLLKSLNYTRLPQVKSSLSLKLPHVTKNSAKAALILPSSASASTTATSAASSQASGPCAPHVHEPRAGDREHHRALLQ